MGKLFGKFETEINIFYMRFKHLLFRFHIELLYLFIFGTNTQKYLYIKLKFKYNKTNPLF